MFSVESSVKDFNQITVLNTNKKIQKIFSKSKSKLLNAAYIKNVCDTHLNLSDKDTKFTKNKSAQNNERFSNNMKKLMINLLMIW